MTTELTGSPQEYGFPEKPLARELNTWALQETFLSAFAETGAVNHSAKAAGHSVEAYHHWVTADTYMFQKRLELAANCKLESMVLEIDRRAFDGYDHPVIHKGIITGTYKAYDPQLAMFRVKKLDPSYRDNFQVMEDVSAIRESLDMLKALGTPRTIEGKSRDVPPSVETEE